MGPADYWYVLCRSDALTVRPLATRLLGQSLVLFRAADSRPVALLDRCAHRNVPLSLGSLRDGALECRYHGWRFSESGACIGVPGHCGRRLTNARVPRFATAEQDGYVWAWGRSDVDPHGAPYRIDPLDRQHTILRGGIDYHADLHASLENTIDVPHTMFLHRKLLRSAGSQQRVQCSVTRDGPEIRTRYTGEQRPDTWLARLLAPGGGTLEHEDRFILPSIVRVEYRLGPKAHLLSTAFFTPLDATHTRLHVETAYRLGVPGAFLAPLLRRVIARVLREDAEILTQQTQSLERFGEKAFASTELDLFSAKIRQLLDEAQAGPIGNAGEPTQREIEIMM